MKILLKNQTIIYLFRISKVSDPYLKTKYPNSSIAELTEKSLLKIYIQIKREFKSGLNL